MQLRPEFQIQTIIKAMIEDVMPALDSTNQLAVQSAQLTIGTLTMIAQHLPLQYRFDCVELGRLVGLAEALSGQASGGARTKEAVTALQKAGRAGSEVLDRARAEPGELLEAIRSLRDAASIVVRSVYSEGPEASQAAVGKTVLSMSQQQLLVDRSWLLMQGWEPDPGSIPAVETLLKPASGG
jgi:hypothetical protein